MGYIRRITAIMENRNLRGDESTRLCVTRPWTGFPCFRGNFPRVIIWLDFQTILAQLLCSLAIDITSHPGSDNVHIKNITV